MHIVDAVLVSDNKDGNRLVRVTTRSVRALQCGDKLSSRHGQKGTVGTMLRAEDMPFVADGPNQGMRPDIIINLQCINGRMTIGKLLEMLYGALGTVQGEIQDATVSFLEENFFILSITYLYLHLSSLILNLKAVLSCECQVGSGANGEGRIQ